MTVCCNLSLLKIEFQVGCGFKGMFDRQPNSPSSHTFHTKICVQESFGSLTIARHTFDASEMPKISTERIEFAEIVSFSSRFSCFPQFFARLRKSRFREFTVERDKSNFVVIITSDRSDGYNEVVKVKLRFFRFDTPIKNDVLVFSLDDESINPCHSAQSRARPSCGLGK